MAPFHSFRATLTGSIPVPFHPSLLVPGTMRCTVMCSTERDCEFITGFAAERPGLQKLQVMRVRRFAAAQQAWLLSYEPQMLLVAVAAGSAQREHALVDPGGFMPIGAAAHAGGFGSRLCVGSCSRSSCCSQEPPNSQRDDAQYAVYSKACLAGLRTAWRAAAKKQLQHLERRIKQSQGLEGRKPQRLLVEGHRVGTASPGAERSNEGVSERAAPFLNSYHGCENLLLALHNENLDL